MRLRISLVTPGKVRLVDISGPPIFEWSRRSSARVPPLQVVEEAADLPDRGTDELGRLPAGPPRQKLQSTGSEYDGSGEQKRRPGHTWHGKTDHAGRDQQPAGVSRQKLDAIGALLGGRRRITRLGWYASRRRVGQSSLHASIPISAGSVCGTNRRAVTGSSSTLHEASHSASGRVVAIARKARFALA